jgi:sulfite exporter TauE/SafE
MTEGFLLGLSSGIYCFATCGPLLTPWLLAEGSRTGRNVVCILLFMGGRLAGYLAYGAVAWFAGQVLKAALPAWRAYVFGVAYIVLSGLLILYAIRSGLASCRSGETACRWQDRLQTRGRWLIPFVGGLVMGLNICPFMLAFTAAAARPSLLASMGFFLMFYLGTSIFFLPLPLLGLLRQYRPLRTIGQLAVGLVGLNYLYSGIIMIVQAVVASTPK